MSERPTLKKLMFNVYTRDEIHDLSVIEVKTSLCFNALDHPIKDGLYDLVMGPSGSVSDACGTCKQTSRHCPGHFGHIDLPVPVVNPLFHKDIFTLLKVSCTNCYKLLIPFSLRNLLIYQLKLLDQGHIAEAEDLENVVSFFETEQTSSEAVNYLVKDKCKDYVEKLNLSPKDFQPSRTTESLRRKFVNNFLRQIVLPKSCSFCKKVVKRISNVQNKLTVSMTKVEIAEKFKDSTIGTASRQETVYITPQESRDMLRKIWAESQDLIEEFFPLLKNSTLEYPTDLFYMDVILVTPPKARPINVLKDQIIENNQTKAYKNIVSNCIILKNLIKAIQNDTLAVLNEECQTFVQSIRGSTPMEKFQECWFQLQGDINNLLDSEMNKMASTKGALGLKQLIEKKEGVLRMHMMGKRVNFAARSVITPDPNLQIQEIGIPEYFAKKLTYPVTVTFFNVEELRKMVRNGPDVYPGAALIENENGSFIRLFAGEENKTKREGMAKLLLKSVETGGEFPTRKKVHRHILNGDILLLNRQPTLHRPSIMAHRARILKGEKTLRMHYSNCKSYNADFDGDEMNAHFPQSDLARSEAYNLVNVCNHYLVPKDGTPLGGLIQDHIVSAVRLTIRGQMFGKDDYHQLVYQGLSQKPGNITLLPPCIIKPKKLWSGKQIISTILINLIPKSKELISFTGSAKINYKSWETEPSRRWNCGRPFKKGSEMSESEVVIQKGILVSGVLDKQHFGATPYGLTHCLYELYGGECSSKFLDSIGKLNTAFLQLNGFTLGVEDILVTSLADEARKQIVNALRNSGEEAAIRALGLKEVPNDLNERLEREFFKDQIKFKAKLDQEYKKILDSYTNEINKVCLPRGLITKFPDNNLQLMVTSGAKGSTVNTMQISCLLGQIELEGRRPPWMISGKSLPCFKPFETQPCAGGYVDSRFMTGITPQEFFFHCMAGREGLIDTAVKTSRSGYLQRCLIKHLEGITVCYDGTVRDHDGSVIQFAYGEDGVEVQKSTFFKPECMDFLYKNRNSLVDPSVIKKLKECTNSKEIENYRKKVAGWDGPEGKKILPFTVFSNSIRDDISEKYFQKFNKSTGRKKAYSKILKKWRSLGVEEKEFYNCAVQPDPLTSKYNRNCEFGVITEKLDRLIQDYLDAKFAGKNKKESKKMRNMLEAKYMLSLCQPGEPVGLLAAQSVGEPSTQMTLNTFHFAGRGEMNVTLGIPRLREVLMTASKAIKTPYIEVPLRKKSEKKMGKNAKKLKKIFQRVTLADVLEKIIVDEKLQLNPVQLFTYTVKFQFLPHACYKNEFTVEPKDILAYMEKPFLISLCKEIRKLGKKYGDIIFETKEEKAIGKTAEVEEDADDVDAAGAASKKMKTLGEDHESSDEEEELDDDDATKAKLRGRHQENQEYEEPNESDEEQSEEEMGENEKVTAPESGDEEVELNLTKEDLKNIENRKDLILKTFAMIKNYRFDVTKKEWCEFVIGIPLTLSKIDFSTVLRTICEKSVLYEVANVKRAIVDKKLSGELTLKTEGVNFIEIFKFNKMLNINKLYSNDIHQVIETYGIEAGVRVIVKELRDVFEVYGITVDSRHLLLIADYMTHQGYFSPFNRTGMADSSSPLQQMSFESSTGFLKNSLARCRQDYLQSPSACIMVGKFCKSGTGCFDVSYRPQVK